MKTIFILAIILASIFGMKIFAQHKEDTKLIFRDGVNPANFSRDDAKAKILFCGGVGFETKLSQVVY